MKINKGSEKAFSKSENHFLKKLNLKKRSLTLLKNTLGFQKKNTKTRNTKKVSSERKKAENG